MFENIKAGWKLGGETRKLIMEDKQLFIYPIISTLVGIILLVALVASFLLVKANTIAILLELFVYYILVYFISTYVIMAMLIAFRSYLQGKRISIGNAFSHANQYGKLILEWAIFDAIITMIIRIIESRFRADFVVRAIIGIVASFTFTVATFFVIPVILDEKLGPIKALKSSAKFIIDNFGKTFGGFLYADLYTFIFIISGIVIMVLGFLITFTAFSYGLLIPGIAVIVIGFALFVFGFIFSYVISNTLKLIIYDYMTNRSDLPKGWDKSLIDNALKNKQKGSNSPVTQSK